MRDEPDSAKDGVMTDSGSIPSLPLNTGAGIPQLGLGTALLHDDVVIDAIAAAADAGIRHVDTAVRYDNEAAVGEGLRRTGIPRDEFFVTTKLDGPFQGADRALGGLRDSLGRLGLEWVDLLLIHWPLPARDLYVDTWRTFERLQAEGLARAIGVSNFTVPHLERLAAETGTVPAVNQIQLDPRITRTEQRAYHEAHGIVTESYSPLGGGGASSLLADPAIGGIAARIGRTPAQVVLRWHVQQGLVAIPRSRNRERLAQNADVFSFELDADAMAALASLDAGPDAGVDSDHVGH
jgi:2,5-diketo-D-gluconate reductase A